MCPIELPRVASGARLGTVLLVDDDELVLRALSRLLATRGYSVRATLSSREAFEDVLRGGCDCVVSDVSMPGMSGLDLIAELRRCDCTTPVVLVTSVPGFDLSSAEGECLSKPVDGDTLTLAIERAIRSTPAWRRGASRAHSAHERGRPGARHRR